MTTGAAFGHLTFALVAFLILPTGRLPRPVIGCLLIALLGAAFLNIDGLSLGEHTRSYTDDLAITTLLWLLWCTGVRLVGSSGLKAEYLVQLWTVFAVLALALYPATLGLTMLDPYRLGFAPHWLLLAMWAICLLLWWWRNYLLVSMISLATLAYLLDVKDSDNYWDYLIDPLFGIYCCTALLRHTWRQWRHRKG